MSRVAKAPVTVPAGVTITLNGQNLTVKGKNGELTLNVNPAVEVVVEGNVLRTTPRDGIANADAQAGTARALINNLVIGVTEGYTQAGISWCWLPCKSRRQSVKPEPGLFSPCCVRSTSWYYDRNTFSNRSVGERF